MLRFRCLVVALALLATFVSDSWGQSKQQPTKTGQQNAAQQERGTENSPVVVKVIPGEKSKDEIARENAKDKEKSAVDERIASLTGDLAFYTKLLFGATAALAVITFGLVIAGFRQVSDAKKAIAAAVDSAAAARISAEAFMNAEGAQIFPVVIEDNLQEVFRGQSVYSVPAESPDVLLLPPKLLYRFKNYGKTPAKLQSVMHNISFLELDSKSRLMHAADDFPLEIIGANETSSKLECEMLDHFKAPMAQAAKQYQAELMFYGEAVFTDFFDRQFRCIWECDGRSGEFALTRHEQRLDPDKKS
jgi:hypothetical protein